MWTVRVSTRDGPMGVRAGGGGGGRTGVSPDAAIDRETGYLGRGRETGGM